MDKTPREIELEARRRLNANHLDQFMAKLIALCCKYDVTLCGEFDSPVYAEIGQGNTCVSQLVH